MSGQEASKGSLKWRLIAWTPLRSQSLASVGIDCVARKAHREPLKSLFESEKLECKN